MNVQKNAECHKQSLGVVAESLYLINLLLLPGLAFLILAWLYFKYENRAPSLAGCHLRQTFSASIWAGLLLVFVNGVIILGMGYKTPYTWLIVIPNFIICHSTLVLLGIFGLVRALDGKRFKYPFIGPSC
ncbi:cytochrome C oxidase subunit III [Candidatus Thiomargarita nelsonii]|uniref:Cytochrome C oxidase subunit III n=1 Tax=Candidatus Thiomargarita nelsonii TaxID=1003181 RepID=A0A4E0QJ11_9GAMM|nr:cytochrome C oxidase subunit III [Candidatus Thiomargarita nelsonii]